MKIDNTPSFWNFDHTETILMILVSGYFLWAIFLPDNTPGLLSFTTARNIIRQGCAAGIDESRHKFRRFPGYIVSSLLLRASATVILSAGAAVIFLAAFLRRPKQLEAHPDAKLSDKHMSQWALSHQRPPPLASLNLTLLLI